MGGESDANRFTGFTSGEDEEVEEEEFSMEKEHHKYLSSSGVPSCHVRDGSRLNVVGDEARIINGMGSKESDEMFSESWLNSADFPINYRRLKAYKEILRSYDELRIRARNLEEAKSKILSYTPGAWIEKRVGMRSSDYNVPKTTSVLLIGPKGSGKSSLVNRISKVLEDDKFAPYRAQVTYNLSPGEGTYFLQEYMIPRHSSSFCLYDTRSLCDNLSDNFNMIKLWMTNGVCHGEPILRKSDAFRLKSRIKCKAHRIDSSSSTVRKVNFVIFVVDGLALLKSMESNGSAEEQYAKSIAASFKCPYLSFKDDKPAVVVTHGDLLSLKDRACVCVYLGELLGVPPDKQIFDIPENCSPVTEMAIIDLLRYCLEHADRNMHHKGTNKVRRVSLRACMWLLLVLGIIVISFYIRHSYMHHSSSKTSEESMAHSEMQDWNDHLTRKFPSGLHIEWHRIKHLWLDDD